MAKKAVFVMGLHPSVVDFSKFPGLNADMMMAALEADNDSLAAAGYEVDFYYIDFKSSPKEAVQGRLNARSYDVIVIGAGVRTDPERFTLFEQLVNIAHAAAPAAKLCFNTRPGDTADAVRRWN